MDSFALPILAPNSTSGFFPDQHFAMI